MVNDWLKRYRVRLDRLAARERRAVVVGGWILLILLAYGVVYEPLRQARAKLLERLPQERGALRQMRLQVVEMEQLRKQVAGMGSITLEQRVRSSAAAMGLGEALIRFSVLAPDRLQLATRPVPASHWSKWLADLESRGVVITRCHILLSDQTGLASLELSLSGGRP